MRATWEKLAKENGFDGLVILNQENVKMMSQVLLEVVCLMEV